MTGIAARILMKETVGIITEIIMIVMIAMKIMMIVAKS
jgi:hypothetical protein